MTTAYDDNLLSNADYWQGKAYLNTAAEGLPLAASLTAVQQYLVDKSRGEPGRAQFWQQYEKSRRGAARLFGVNEDQIALVSSTTEALNTVAHSIDWQPGDEVVLTSVEFPSNIFPWVKLKQQGVKLRIVHPRPDGVSMDELLGQIGPRTRLVTFSQVSYATGEQLSPEPIWEKVRDTETLLCIDATQAAGRVPVDGTKADFTIASTFKWLNSIHGASIMAVSPRVLSGDLLGPAGWLSAASCYAPDRLERFTSRADAQRFQAGMPNFDSLYSLAAALEFHTPERVASQAQVQAPLIQSLREQLLASGFEVLVPEESARQAGIVPIVCPQAEEWKQLLAEQNVFVHGDDGRIRAAVHWYNTSAHLEQFLAALKSLPVAA